MATKPNAGGSTVTRTGLAEVFGVSFPTVDTWVRQGCPVLRRGSRGVEWAFDTAAVIKWREQRAAENAAGNVQADEAELKRRKLEAETKLAELEFAKAKGDVAPVREFERAQSMMMAAIQQNVMNVPTRAVLRLLGETGEKVFKQVLREELALALQTAAEAANTLPNDDDNDE